MEFVLAELIRKHKPSSWLALQRNIKAANQFRLRGSGRKKPKITIDRRKLQDIAEEKPTVPLTPYELELLDAYLLRKDGKGLAEIPIFRREENLFHTLSRAERVSFFLGLRSIDPVHSEMISRWDHGALSAIKDRISRHVETETFEVLTRDAGRPLEPKEWNTLRGEATGNVVVSIASPVASASSEYLLAEMFEIAPYRARGTLPPLCFAHAENKFPSTFTPGSETDGCAPDSAALLINGESYVADKAGTDYAVVVGKRTSPEHAAFVVAGVGGPGTLAAAEFFASGLISTPLPRYERKGKQPVLVVLLSTQIHASDTDRPIDRRTISGTEMVEAPMVFRHSSGKGWALEEGGS